VADCSLIYSFLTNNKKRKNGYLKRGKKRGKIVQYITNKVKE